MSVEQIAERLTTADLDALAAALPDDALAHFALAGVRQLRRRLARAGMVGRSPRASKGASKGRGVSALERVAHELAAVLGGTGEE